MRSIAVKICLIAAIATAATSAGANMAIAADAGKGKVAFTKNGCWQCHGFAGQGSILSSGGRVITRTQLPLEAFKTFVRTTDGAMPPYRPPVLSDDDLDNIYAYLQSLPAPKSFGDIPTLNSARTQ